MKQLASVRFAGQSAEEIVAFLVKSGTGVSSAKIEQGIALAILDGKRPANSGTLKKFVRAKCAVEITPHAFSVAVAFAALNGKGVGFVEEEKFILVPLNWHLQASAILNLVADPKANLDDAGRAAVHEEVAEIFRAKPDKGEELLKLIKSRFKPAETPDAGDGKENESDEPFAKLPPEQRIPRLAKFLAEMLQKENLKKLGLEAAALTDIPALQATFAHLGSIDVPMIGEMMPVVLEAVTEAIGNITTAETPAEPAEPVAAAA